MWRSEYRAAFGKTKEQINWQKPSLFLLKHNTTQKLHKSKLFFLSKFLSNAQIGYTRTLGIFVTYSNLNNL